MFIVINRIKTVTVPVLILLAGIFSAGMFDAEAEKIPHSVPGKVRILILSKTMRLLKEGKIDQADIRLEKTCGLSAGEKTIPCRSLSIYYRNGSFHVTDGQNMFTGQKLTLYPEKNDDTFSIRVNEERRVYPLPLVITHTGPDIELSVEDTADQYSIDSAIAEIGNTTDSESEALYALANLIKARCSMPYLKNKHKGYDFCDLTCCQSYKGRIGKIFTDAVSIKTDKIRNGLFFHSSGGGVLFTDSIFSSRTKTSGAPKDIIYSENLVLSRGKYPAWNSSVTIREISGILYPQKKITVQNIIYDSEREIILIETNSGREQLSPESFRLALNRIRGWNFIRSNNYTLTKGDGIYKFTGSGLGHGTGLSMEGALQLAVKGYSRYEILEHYYPELEYNITANASGSMMQYIIFNLDSGEIIKIHPGTSFMNRTVPCGSLFKLFIALYLSSERKDLFHEYIYTCSDREKDGNMPEKCWNRTGHGRLDITGALCRSCNKYFASLYRVIDPADFKLWLGEFTRKRGISLSFPEFTQKKDFASVLAGLDFRVTITVHSMMKLARLIYLEGSNTASPEMEKIFTALHKTFSEGTAKDDEKTESSLRHHDERFEKNMWGKTGTVITGTNSHHGYGIFAGGNSSIGIISLLRKGTGALAAKKSAEILYNYSEKIPMNLSE